MQVQFYEEIEDQLLKFAVILSKYQNKWVFCKHKLRDTFEIPGGHREENENILDMQGITEAVSRYFYSNGDSFDGLFVAPEYQDRFERLASDAIEYYEN